MNSNKVLEAYKALSKKNKKLTVFEKISQFFTLDSSAKIRIKGCHYCSNCTNRTAIITKSEVRNLSYLIEYTCTHCNYQGTHSETHKIG